MHILKDFITIDDLKTRWSCEIDLLESFTHRGDDTPYLAKWKLKEVRKRPDGGTSAIAEFFSSYYNPKDLTFMDEAELRLVIFNMEDVLSIEAQNPELVQTKSGTDGYIEIREPMIYADKVLERWTGISDYELGNIIDLNVDSHNDAPTPYCIHKILKSGQEIIAECTKYEIYMDNDTGEIIPRPYLTYELDCTPIYDFTNIAFKLAEIIEYEKTRPKLFYKKVKDPNEAWKVDPPMFPSLPECIPAEELRKELGMSPIQFVDFLNKDNNPNRLVTSWEENFRRKVEDEGWRGADRVPFFEVEDLDGKGLTVHRLDWERFQQRERELEEAMADVPFGGNPSRLSELETQLAEAQKRIERLGRWNEQFMKEGGELRKTLVEKDARIDVLEKELAAARGKQGKRDNSAATIGGLKNDVKSWKAALPTAVSATGKLLAAETTKKTRSELLLFVCETCASKCDDPKTPCAVFSKEQFEAWRNALPPDHVDKIDRSTYPPNTVEAVGREQ